MKQFNFLIKPVSGSCNMRCSYCFYTDEMQHRSNPCAGRMSSETIACLLERTFAEIEPGGTVTFSFQGGEPTLAGPDFYESFVQAARSRCPANVSLQFSLQTNGLLIDDAWADFLAKESFLVGLSIDGKKDLHNHYRRNAAGSGTWTAVTRALRILQQHDIPVNALCVVTKDCAKEPHKVYRELKRLGLDHFQFIACMEPMDTQRGAADYALTPQLYAEFLCRLFDLWYQDWMAGTPVNIRLFEDYVHLLLKDGATTCSACGSCGGYLVLEADGSVYPCDFYCLDEWKLGNIQMQSLNELLHCERMSSFRKRSSLKPSECSSCRWRPLCRGGCPHDWVRMGTLDPEQPAHGNTYGSGSKTRNYYCQTFSTFLSYAFPRLHQIAAEERSWQMRHLLQSS